MRRALGTILVATVAIWASSAPGVLRPLGADHAVTESVTYDAGAQRYTLRATGTFAVAYTVSVAHADVQQGMLRVEGAVGGGSPVAIVASGGTRYRAANDAVREPADYAPTAGAVLQQHGIVGQEVVLQYQEQPGAHALTKTYRFRLEGVALVIEVRSTSTWGLDGYAGVSLGWAEGVAGSRVVTLPYLPEPAALLPDGSVLGAFIDPTVSSAVAVTRTLGEDGAGRVYVHGRSLSEPDTAGVAAPLSETCWVTLSPDLDDLFPQVTAAASPHRAALRPLVVMDVWGLHRAFSVDEGVAYAWTSPEAGAAHVTLRYADGNPGCGDGVAIVLRHRGALVARLAVANGETQERLHETDLALQMGDVVQAEILRAGTNACDGTALRMTITAPADTYDTQTDFSGTQGQRGLSYLEILDGTATPLSWDAGDGQWHGAGAFARLWPGGGHPGEGATAWRDARNMVRRYAEHGMSHLAIIFHVWQRWGYDQGLPDHHPANPAWGTDAEMTAFVAAAREAGMLVALHENYTDMYPDNAPTYPSPLYDATAIAHDRTGAAKLGWLNDGTGQQAFRIAARRMGSFAALESPSIAAGYAPNAAYLDVSTGWSPGMAIDHSAGVGAVPTLRDAHDATIDLFTAMKGYYGGPLFGEGGEGLSRFDSYFAGAVDAVERQIEGRSRAAVAPDYELHAVKPRMLNHGLGYYSRYFTDGAR
ncbi:MAG: hypothetical protein HY906_26850 [Deltaproteobacteria bacterium]|nr:hypothetical protein [Deltaproteobacteria bacterium]